MNKKIGRLAFTAIVAVSMVNCVCAEPQYTPTRGADAGYTIKDTKGTSNTGMGVLIPTYDAQGNITGTTTKYVDVKAKTYTKEGVSGNLTYTWDGKKLTVEPANLGIKDTVNGQYIGNTGVVINNNSGSVMENAIGDFVGNSATNAYNSGIISNSGNIQNITGNFIANTFAQGSAIYNAAGASIGNITADFIGNYDAILDGKAATSFIFNSGGTISNIKGDFIGNYTEGQSTLEGGAISNKNFGFENGKIGTIEGNFVNNALNSTKSSTAGGAIYSTNSTIDKIKGDFIGNSITSANYSGRGGALCLNNSAIEGSTTTIEGNFFNNSAAAGAPEGGAIAIGGQASINNSVFKNNFVQGNQGTNFGAAGGAIYSSHTLTITDSVFSNNSASNTGGQAHGGAIKNHGTMTISNSDFSENSVDAYGSAYGGAISNASYNDTSMIINDTSFINNTAASTHTIVGDQSRGGAIYNAGGGSSYNAKLEINAKNKDVVFRGNKADSGAAIYNANPNSPIELNATGGNILFENNNSTGTAEGDGIGIYSWGGLNMTASNNNKITINDAIDINGTTSVNGGTVALGQKAATTTFNTFNIAGDTTLDLQNSKAGDVITVGTLSGNGNLKLNADYDGSTGVMDKITVNGGSGKVTLNAIKIVTDGNDGVTDYLDGTARDNVTVITDSIVSTTDDHKYTFTPFGSNGHLLVIVDGISGLSLADAISDEANGSSYTMGKDYTFEQAAGALDGSNRDFTIFGQNHTIDGGNFGGIQISNGQSLTIDNATVQNFDSGYSDGGAIYNTGGKLVINDTDFTGNSAFQGGAIYMSGSNSDLEINALTKDVVFSGNKGNNNRYAAISNTTNNPIKLNAIGGNILFENNNYAGTAEGAGGGIGSVGGLIMTASEGKKITINDQIGISGTTSVNGGTVALGQKAASTNFPNFKIAGDTTLDLQNAKAGDNLIIGTLSGDGNLKLNTDYNASTGVMDKIDISNGSGKITLNAIKVLTDGTATETDYLSGTARNNVTVITDAITSSTDGYKYTFTPNGDKGHLLVSREVIGNLDLATAIADASVGGSSYTMASDYTFTAAAGALNGKNRDFTIFGQNHIIDGGGFAGISLLSDQALTVENATMQNFNRSDWGGALSNYGTVTLNNVDIKNNQAYNGAGVYTGTGSKLTVNNSKFTNNTANATNSNGGAIYNWGSLELNNVAFEGNTASTGGAINSNKSMELNDVTFEGNTANATGSSGGAIYVYSNNSSGEVKTTINAKTKDVVFRGNKANYGAAIYNQTYDIPLELNATGGNILFENNNSTGTAEGTGTGIYSASGLKMTAANGKKITINDSLFISKTTSVNGGTVALGQKAASSNFNTFEVAGDTTLDLRNSNAGDIMIVGTLSGDGNLKLNTDYDASTGVMDKINISNGSGKITLNAIKVLTDGTAPTTDYLGGTARNNVTVVTDAITSSTQGYKYTFTPDGDNGHLLVSREEVVGLDLAKAISDATLGGSSYTMNDDYTFTAAAGALDGQNRDFTIFGQSHAIDGGEYGGIQISNGQALTVENATMRNFKNASTGLGGAIRSNSANVTITNSEITNNTASNSTLSNGGGVYITDGVLTLNNTSFKNNIAAGANSFGGAIGARNAKIIVNAADKDVVFSGNKAANGAAIYNINSDKPIELNATGGNILFENNNSTGTAEGTGYGIITTGGGGLKMTASDGCKITINDAVNISGTTSVNGGTVALGQKAASTTFSNFDIAGDTILDLRNSNAGDTLTIGTLSGSGNLKLNTDYNGSLGTMDKLTVNGGSGKVTLNAIKILTDGAATETNYLDGAARNNVTVITNAITSSTSGYKYTFTPNGNNGHLLVSREVIGDLDLEDAIINAGDGGSSYTMDSDFAFTSDAGNLDGKNRDFTIFGEGNNIDGGGHNGIVVSDGQALSVEDVSEYKNFSTALNNSGKLNIKNTKFVNNTTDINNTKELNLSGTNTLKTITGSNGTTKISGGKTTISENGSVAQKEIRLNGAELVVSNGATINSNVIGMSPNRIVNDGTIAKVSGTYSGNSSTDGGAVYTTGVINSLSGNYTNNSVTGNGGAIYNSGTINIVADDSNTVFTGNTANGQSNAIYQAGTSTKNAVINLNASNGKSIVFNDKISGTSSEYNKINIGNSASSGTVDFNNTVTNNDINLYNGTLHIGSDLYLDGNNVTFNGGTFSMANGAVGTTHFNTLSLAGDTKLHADVDLVNASMDRITADSYSSPVGSLIVEGLHIVNETADTKDVTVPFVVDDAIKDSVKLDNSAKVYSPLYGYKVGFNSESSTFSFNRNTFNPSILVSSIGALTGGYLNQLNSYENAFNNMDMNMMMNAKQRTAYKFANRYASAETPMVYSPTFMPQADKGVWFRPYTSIESIGLKNGPKVDNVMYGAFVGGDSKMYSLSNGVDMQYSAYMGYTGSHQSYGSNGIYQNGGMLGATAALYAGDFFGALTANVGASGAEASTMFGNEEFGMFTTGVAGKMGYNWELASGKFIIQPSYMMSYSFIDTFNYTNAAGTKIYSSPMHALNISPGIKFIGNFGNGWQPYAGFNVVWNLLGTTDFYADKVAIPSLSVKPYFQYGVGLQKLWDDRQSGFIQFLMRSGGRNGFAFNVGYKYALGK